MFSQIGLRCPKMANNIGRCLAECLSVRQLAITHSNQYCYTSAARSSLTTRGTISSHMQNLETSNPMDRHHIYIVVSHVRNMAYDNSNEVHKKIQTLLDECKKPAFLFMKGVPSEPACGYSNVVVQILEAYGVEYDSCNVLADENIRSGIKTFSDWPTVPQLFVNKTFVGGCDLLLQMHQSGELEKLFDDAKKANQQKDNDSR